MRDDVNNVMSALIGWVHTHNAPWIRSALKLLMTPCHIDSNVSLVSRINQKGMIKMHLLLGVLCKHNGIIVNGYMEEVSYFFLSLLMENFVGIYDIYYSACFLFSQDSLVFLFEKNKQQRILFFTVIEMWPNIFCVIVQVNRIFVCRNVYHYMDVVSDIVSKLKFYRRTFYSNGIDELVQKHDIYYHGFILIPAWIINYLHYKVWDEITYPFPNFNWSLGMDK